MASPSVLEDCDVKTEAEILVVVPLYNEAHGLEDFFYELRDAMEVYGKPYEVIFVNDGSTDDSLK